MASHGSPMFVAYTRTLTRIFWAEFVDSQLTAARPSQFRASLVDDPLPGTEHLGKAFEYHRHRPTWPQD
ncbi:MAG: hypothetical protein ABL907_16020 [Hyphomicrobium sp.]